MKWQEDGGAIVLTSMEIPAIHGSDWPLIVETGVEIYDRILWEFLSSLDGRVH